MTKKAVAPADAAGDVIVPISKRRAKDLKKLERRLHKARREETKRLDQLAAAQAGEGPKAVAKRSKQVARSSATVAKLTGRIDAIVSEAVAANQAPAKPAAKPAPAARRAPAKPAARTAPAKPAAKATTPWSKTRRPETPQRRAAIDATKAAPAPTARKAPAKPRASTSAKPAAKSTPAESTPAKPATKSRATAAKPRTTTTKPATARSSAPRPPRTPAAGA